LLKHWQQEPNNAYLAYGKMPKAMTATRKIIIHSPLLPSTESF
jgi:hypothetical protein